MTIVINGQLIDLSRSYRGAGVSQYSRHLLQAVGKLNVDRRIVALVNDPNFFADGIEVHRTRWPVGSPISRIAWEQMALPRTLSELDADLVHGLVNVLPLGTSRPGVVTVHDLSFLRTPEAFPRSKRLYLSALCRASVGRARRVIAVSKGTAEDLISLFSTEARKIEVVYNGVAQNFQPPPESNGKKNRRPDVPERYMLYLGTLEPRKNLVRLIEGYAAWRQTSKENVALVIAGARGWFYDRIFERVRQLDLEENVRFPGFVPDQELAEWYQGAELFIYPSLFEGFGLPVLESMACATPVICSDARSLREVAGDAALYFERQSSHDLTRQLSRFYSEPELAGDLRRRGLARAAQFSWERCAQETLAVYDRALA